MEHRGNEAREQIEDDGRRQDPGHLGEVASNESRPGEDNRLAKAVARQSTGVQGSSPKREMVFWTSPQSALYVLVLGAICILLAPLTSFWWLALVCGTVVPTALALLERPGLTARRPDERRDKERELLHVLAERGELTPTTAAMRTSLTVGEASKMLEELVRKGHLKLQVEDGIIAYALYERNRHETLGEVSAPLETEPESDRAQRRLGAHKPLDAPLSERELEVLNLLASGRTNSEIARDLFVSVGTVKSHTGNIYRKLDAKNRAEALARARALKVLQ